jgi:branched-chain amino acid transport system substrate-binding protein
MTRRDLAVLVALLVGAAVATPPAAAAQDTIKIGALYNLTGGMSSIDVPGLNGMKLAAKEINAGGGVLGKRIELLTEDGKTDQTTNANIMSRFVSQKPVAVAGLNDTSFVLAAGPIAQRAKVPFVTAGATAPQIPEQVGDYMFMAPFGDDAQAFAIADHAFHTLKARNAWILTDQAYDFTTTLSKFFKQRWDKVGGKVALEDIYRSGDVDFSAQITRLRSLRPAPDVLFVSAIPNEAGLIIKQVRQAGIKTPIVSGDGFDTPLVVDVPGKDLADGVYFSTHAYVQADSPKPVIKRFVAAYEKEYGKPPENAFAALGYDTLRLVADAIRRAGAADPQKVRDALAQTRGFEGVTGAIGYSGGSRVPKKGVTIIEVEKGKLGFAGEVTP